MDDLIRVIQREGPVPFRRFMETALYGPRGFYTTGGGAGRRRDFITSPEVGDLFGRVIARALDSWWDAMGCPDPFIVAECGAGPGALARSVHRCAPRCSSALRYLLVDRSPMMRDAQRAGRLPFVDLAQFLGGHGPMDDDGELSLDVGQGPLCSQADHLPAVGVHVVLANELIDNLPFDVFERSVDGWKEIRVGWDGRLREVAVGADASVASALDDLVGPTTGVAGRVPWHVDAVAWLQEALSLIVEGGKLVCVDYARGSTAEFLTEPWTAWLRTYREHGRAGQPLDEPGDCDITTDIAVDQLAKMARPTRVWTQAEFLRDHGIDAIVEEARDRWLTNAANPSLADLAARSLVGEADALLDPAGLGGFTVIEWDR